MPQADQNPEQLNAIIQAVEDVFLRHNANNLDRIDVLAQAAGYALSWSAPPDPEAALVKFADMVRDYRDRFALLTSKPEGTA